VKLDVKRIAVILLVAFVALSLWTDPAGTADVFGSFFSTVGDFLANVVDKGATFFRSLID
jgi:hypothetical protein